MKNTTRNSAELTVAQVGDIAGCHRNTVLNYERKNLIRSMRDRNNYRRFSVEDALKLKSMLTSRTPSTNYERPDVVDPPEDAKLYAHVKSSRLIEGRECDSTSG
jgi:hypothetical protein